MPPKVDETNPFSTKSYKSYVQISVFILIVEK